MFLSYDTIGYLKGPDIALVKDVETGTVAVRKKLRAELLGVYERLKSVEQANLPRVYETEEYEGECFAYYEYIEGETLEDIVHEGTYTIAQAEEWMEQLCAAMGALHAMQPCVVHRDIKPENIIISNRGVLKLIDLGAARLFKDGKLCDTEQIGTRGYAAPAAMADMKMYCFQIRSFPSCKQSCPTNGSFISTVFPAISHPPGRNTKTTPPPYADGRQPIPPGAPRNRAYPITPTRRDRAYDE